MGLFIGGASEWANHEVTEYPEVITRRARGTHKAKTERKSAKPHAEPVVVTGPGSDPCKATRRKPRKLSDDDALAASKAVEGGNSLRSEAKALGVSHVALRERIQKLQSADGYAPDELDKAIIRAALATGLPGVLGRLSDILGWTRIEILEAVK